MVSTIVLMSATGGILGASLAAGFGHGLVVVAAAYCLSGFLAASTACILATRRL